MGQTRNVKLYKILVSVSSQDDEDAVVEHTDGSDQETEQGNTFSQSQVIFSPKFCLSFNHIFF